MWEGIHFKFTSKYAHKFTSPQQSISPKESLIPQGELHTSLSMGKEQNFKFFLLPTCFIQVCILCLYEQCLFVCFCPPPPPKDEAIFKVSGLSSDRPGKRHRQQH